MQADSLLSPHFHLSEFTRSQTAERFGIANVPNAAQLQNLGALARMLEQVRTVLGVPLLLSSGFRSPELNRLVGGAQEPPSAHLDGRAADFTAPGFGPPLVVCRCLAASSVAFDHLIFEGTWVHLGIAKTGATPRRMVITARFQTPGRASYSSGLPT
jgi:zinc D-Ala-D-Ala carboxypeptidase